MAFNAYELLLKIKTDPNSVDNLKKEIDRIQTEANQKAKITYKIDAIFDDKGKETGEEYITMLAKYTNNAASAVTETIKFKTAVDALQNITALVPITETGAQSKTYTDTSGELQTKLFNQSWENMVKLAMKKQEDETKAFDQSWQNMVKLAMAEQDLEGKNLQFQANEQQKLAEEDITNTRKIELQKQEDERRTWENMVKLAMKKQAMSEKQQLEEYNLLAQQQSKIDAMVQKSNETTSKYSGKSGSPKIQAVLDIQEQIRVQGQLAQQMKDIGNIPGANQYIKSMEDLQNKSKIAEKSLGGVKGALENLRDGFTRAIKNVIDYAGAYAIVNGALTQFKDGIQYVKDLNKELTNIQLVTGGSDAEIKNLAIGYNNLAKEMGATTLTVAQGSLEFIRQGKTAEETGILIRNSTMMSKLGNLTAIESSEALTSIMNGFKMKAQETGDVVSKLVAIKFVATHSNMWKINNRVQYC